VNAVVALAPDLEDQWRASAQRLETSRARSLEGVPILVKDNILAKGMPCTWGSRLFRDYVPEHDEVAVERLRAAGAIVVGKTNVPEFTLEGYTGNALFGVTRNPWDLSLTPGGSSGGSVAAVAAGIVPLALGTDGGGSIRRPASHTGLVGLKPSIGAVPRVHMLPAILLDLEVVGPIGRTVGDVRLLFDVISEPRPYQSKARASVLYVPTFGEAPLDAEIRSSLEDAARQFAGIGCEVETGNLPIDLAPLEAFWPKFAAAGVAWLMSMHPGKEDLLGERMQAVLEQGRALGAAQYIHGLALIHNMRHEARALFSRYDFVLTPSAAALPWPAESPWPETIDGKKVGPRGHAVYTAWVNACGIPAISLPCVPSRRGLPIGCQLVGGFGADRALLDMAARYEAAYPWRSPPRLPASA
jgi:aspartyl-tRNA(Asn)/glutamyl-tRNA(Gln) amidotransferase subunit A